MDWATSDYSNTYSDVYLPPEPDDGGVYLLEEGGKVTHPNVSYRDAPQVRMRGGVGLPDDGYTGPEPRYDGAQYFPKEGMRGRPQNGVRIDEGRSKDGRFPGLNRSSAEEYQESMPSETTLRSRQGRREEITKGGWDGRPRGFRPDDGVADSAFLPPYQLRPWGGGVRTPWQVSWAPSYSEAINRPTDPSMYGLAPCGPTYVAPPPPAWLATTAAPGYSEGFAADAAKDKAKTSAEITITTPCVAKIVLFFIIIVLLAMWVVSSVMEKQMKKVIRRSLKEAVDGIKTTQ